MNVFDIIGPVMIGPSSSHTAGAVRIGRVANKLMDGKKPASLEITLAGISSGIPVDECIDAMRRACSDTHRKETAGEGIRIKQRKASG